MRHRDAFFPDPRAAAPGPVDPVQDLLLPVGQRQLAPARRVPGWVELLVLRLLVLRLLVLCLLVLCLLVLCLLVLGMLAQGLVDPARLALDPVAHLVGGHDRPTWAASATRVRFIRPKL